MKRFFIFFGLMDHGRSLNSGGVPGQARHDGSDEQTGNHVRRLNSGGIGSLRPPLSLRAFVRNDERDEQFAGMTGGMKGSGNVGRPPPAPTLKLWRKSPALRPPPLTKTGNS